MPWGAWGLCCEACLLDLTWMKGFTMVYGIYVTSICDKIVLNVHASEVHVLGLCRPIWIARCLEDKR